MCLERSVQLSDIELRDALKRVTEDLNTSGPKDIFLIKRSRICAALNLWEQSKLDAFQAVELNPSSLVANYRLSVALLQLGQPSEALKFAGNALKLSPRHPQLRACLHAILDSLECVNEETVPETHLEQPRSAEKDKKADVRRTLEDGARDKTSVGGGSPQTWDGREDLDILGLEKDPEIIDIRRAFLERVGSVHPDKGGSAEDFAKLRQAYETLLTSATARGCKPESAGAKEDGDYGSLRSQGGESVGDQLPCTADQVTEAAYWQFQRDTAVVSHEKGRQLFDAGDYHNAACHFTCALRHMHISLAWRYARQQHHACKTMETCHHIPDVTGQQSSAVEVAGQVLATLQHLAAESRPDIKDEVATMLADRALASIALGRPQEAAADIERAAALSPGLPMVRLAQDQPLHPGAETVLHAK